MSQIEMGLNIPCLAGLLPFMAMVSVECLDVGLTTLSKAAMSRGMNHFTFVVYSNALAAFLLFFPTFLFNTNRIRRNPPPLTFPLLGKFFLLSLIGITIMQNCVFTGVGYSSPTLGSAMSNLVPAFTFLLSIIFRMERVDLRSYRSLVKVLGTLVSITGAVVVTLYKGSPVGPSTLPPKGIVLSSSSLEVSNQDKGNNLSNWVIGGCFLAMASFSLSVWNIAQAVILTGYPSEMTIVFFYCLFGAVQSGLVALVTVNGWSAWEVKLDIGLIAIIYSAVVGSMFSFYVLTWCIHKKGPLFVAMFKPLGIAIAAVFGVIFLGDTLYVGSIAGAAIIVLGFYAVIWSQSGEEKTNYYKCKDKTLRPHANPKEDPLLQ